MINISWLLYNLDASKKDAVKIEKLSKNIRLITKKINDIMLSKSIFQS